MSSKIIIAATAAFAAACNKSISAADQAVELRDIALTPDGKLSALLVPVSGRHPSATGSLHEVTVLTGTPAEVETELAEAQAANPHTGALKLLVTGAPADPDAPAASKKKAKPGVLVVLGAFQP